MTCSYRLQSGVHLRYQPVDVLRRTERCQLLKSSVCSRLCKLLRLPPPYSTANSLLSTEPQHQAYH